MEKNVVSETITVNKAYNKSERDAIASEIVDHIRSRTKKGQGKNMKPWKGKRAVYSSAYINSLAGKIGGKTKSSKVNIQLSGDTMASVKTLNTKTTGKIIIGIPKSDKDKSDWNKAKGNILGTYGQKTPIRGKDRRFLDIGKADMVKVLKKFPVRNTEKRKREAALIARALNLAGKTNG